ncbi:Retrovirus-related Pol polyprotein from transposon gypsy,Retrovirus-related Pol polyprotein from transposon 297,Retrovirus-related Pol polyprotein from transposon 17.6 [Mytilus coruscus]|uniref:Retrovirus-related Pol polyprotein from transposon gypsy,Retrovirus-related Pol polyprotein from transposon 297,Retrovirus-related Pol polyprotein from transposon 17.6 n=1 Tax=Mytilus coruscus TaxID=42192 RepID=A0A6J8C4T2_MYTCO|nr:Retrovirus-related Pol polyprotein from transposon gypsy,Retrovirus-related Pol polyprotein from transposon 297,Retrovirus-related Pol polyprotein from transposon 17.6 [Mytilus coruscus]
MVGLADQYREARHTSASNLINKGNQSNSFTVKSHNSQKPVDNARKEQKSKPAKRNFIPVRDKKVNLQKTSSALSEDKKNFKGKICNTCTTPTDSIVDAIPTGCTSTLPSSCQSITNVSMPVSSGYVDGKPVTVLRDTGCSGIVVKRDMVDNESLTGRKQVKDIITDDVNPSDINKAQLEDTTFDKIRRYVLTGDTDASKNGTVKWILKRGMIYRQFSRSKPNKVSCTQLVVPKSYRETVTRLAHESTMSGHLGTQRSLVRVLSAFYWPGVSADGKRFCQSCDICQRTVPKGKIGKVPLQSMPLIDEPFKRVAIDLFGTLFPRTDREIDDPEVKSTYQYVIDLRERLESTCKLARSNLECASRKNKDTDEWKDKNVPCKFIEKVCGVGDIVSMVKDNILAVVSSAVIDTDSDQVDVYDEIHKIPFTDAGENAEHIDVNPNLNESQILQVKELLFSFPEVFTDSQGCTDLLEHDIKLSSETPFRMKPYPIPYSMLDTVNIEVIGYSSLECLGHFVGDDKLKPHQDKVKALQEAPRPVTKKQVRSFLGLVGFYRKFIPNFSCIVLPLTDFTKKGQPNIVVWENVQENEFQSLRCALVRFHILKLLDFSQIFVLMTDASDRGICAVLTQIQEIIKMPIAYASRKLKKSEVAYSTIEKECLAIVWAIQKFQRYLFGREFILETDHQSLNYLDKKKVANARLMR